MFEGVQCTHILCFIGVTLKQWLRNLVHLKLFSQFCLASKVPAYQLVHAIEHFERIHVHCLICVYFHIIAYFAPFKKNIFKYMQMYISILI